jgi:hypothetical protein
MKKKEIRRNSDRDQIRTHCVSSRMSTEELALLDERRGKYARGEYLRLAFLKSLPPAPVPALNREAWLVLSKCAGNLETLATAMRGGDYIPLDLIKDAVEDFRRELIGVEE